MKTGAKLMQPVIIDDGVFHDLITRRGRAFLSVVDYVSHFSLKGKILARPLLGEILSKSMQMVELLDSYGAKNNDKWCYFRSMTSAIKLFSDLTYELLHIQHSIPAYRLITIDEDFEKITEETLLFTSDILLTAIDSIAEEAENLDLHIEKIEYDDEECCM
jgi:hypothetical protein